MFKKSRKTVFLIFSMLVILVLNGCTAKDFILKYELKKGDIYKYQVTTDMKMAMNIPTMGNQEIPLKMSYNLEQNVVDVKNDIYTIDYNIKNLKMDGIPGEAPPIDDVKITVTMDKQGKVLDYKSNLVNSTLQQNDFSREMQIVYPTEAIVKDKPFVIKYKIPVPGAKEPVNVDATLTYKGDEKKQDKDTYKVITSANVPLNLTLKQNGANIKMSGSEKVSGTSYIDKKTGMPVEYTANIDMSITMEEIGKKKASGEKINTSMKGSINMVLVK